MAKVSWAPRGLANVVEKALTEALAATAQSNGTRLRQAKGADGFLEVGLVDLTMTSERIVRAVERHYPEQERRWRRIEQAITRFIQEVHK